MPLVCFYLPCIAFDLNLKPIVFSIIPLVNFLILRLCGISNTFDISTKSSLEHFLRSTSPVCLSVIRNKADIISDLSIHKDTKKNCNLQVFFVKIVLNYLIIFKRYWLYSTPCFSSFKRIEESNLISKNSLALSSSS